ncbi:neprilysin-1 [Rhipicephalus sanguineus]|uniref:neprilysin-1 n=1 Tax=Rhipicephalus sanguineus TaxID=34632 RepID=UPI0020C2C683|nr:neprilysin-1 [Rhipicephalus sanguineus]
MLSNIRNAFRQEFQSSSWVTDEDRRIAIGKLANIRAYVGSPGQRLAPDSVERLYKSYPDVPTNSLFPSWIKAVGVSAHQLWADQKTWIYDETDVNAYYALGDNTLSIPTAIIARPVYSQGGVEALNYGGLGAERQKARQELSNYHDSENLADVVGVKIAYGGFSSLPRRQRRRILFGTNISAERLYFIGHCVKWCKDIQFGSGRYAQERSRCIVPLMNMPEFSDAFGCAAGDLMNPAERCGFWT